MPRNHRLNLIQLASQLRDIKAKSESSEAEYDTSEIARVEDHLLEALAHVRSLRNLSSPINQLPSDILTRIITLSQAPIPSRWPIPLPLGLHAWINAAYVCRQWRRVILSVPELWSHVDFDEDSLERGSVWFDRSGQVPIQLYYTGRLPSEDIPSHGLLSCVFRDMTRLEELHVSSKWSSDSTFWKLVEQPAPILTSLSLSFGTDPFEKGVALPCLFTDSTPNLRNISLQRVGSWTHNHFINLTRFSIYDQPFHSRPTLPEFLSFLAASPCLEELVIVRAGPISYDFAQAKRAELLEGEPPLVKLDQLRLLELGDCNLWSGREQHVRRLLRHIVAPTTTEYCFWGDKQRLPVLEYFNHREDGLSPASLRLQTIQRIVLTPYDTPSDHQSLIAVKGTTLYCNDANELPNLANVPAGDKMNSFTNVHQLIYVQGSSWRRYADHEILKHLPSLRSISISGELRSDPENFLRTLNTLGPPKDKHRSFLYAPELEQFHVFRFSPIEGGETARDISEEDEWRGYGIAANVRANNRRPLKFVLEDFGKEVLEELGEQFEDTFSEALEVGLGDWDVRNVWLAHHRSW